MSNLQDWNSLTDRALSNISTLVKQKNIQSSVAPRKSICVAVGCIAFALFSETGVLMKRISMSEQFRTSQRSDSRVLSPLWRAIILILSFGVYSLNAQANDTHVVYGVGGVDNFPGILGGSNECIYTTVTPPPSLQNTPCDTLTHALDVADSGDTIRIENGPLLECDIVINKDITIVGIGPSPVVIDAGNACRHFNISPNFAATVTLQNIKLINGSEFNGGSIRVSLLGELTLLESRMTGNNATNGGAIYNQGTTIIGRNTELTENSASSSGGAVFNTDSGSVTIRNESILRDNDAVSGGAIHNAASNAGTDSIKITNSLLVTNTASVVGGAINSIAGRISINRSDLNLNSAGTSGGAIASLGTTATLTDTTLFANFTSLGNGGGISNGEGTVLTLNDSLLWANIAAADGGGISNFRATTTLIESTVSGNSARDGAGIANFLSGVLTLRDSSLLSNTAGRDGGAVFDNSGATTTTIRRNTFRGNTAVGNGGAVQFTGSAGGVMEVINSTFSGNESAFGAAVYSTGNGDVLIANSTLYGQITGPFGGAVFSNNVVPMGMSNSIMHNTMLANGASASDCNVNLSMNGTRNRSDNCYFVNSNYDFNIGIVQNLDTVLADNGGPTDTHRLLKGSNAIDSGAGGCLNPTTGAPLPMDQRKVGRPVDGDGDGVAQCDIGSYEYTPPPTPSISQPAVL